LVGLSKQAAVTTSAVLIGRPWRGPGPSYENLAVNVTRLSVRGLLEFTSSLSTEEQRAVEALLDAACQVVMPPLVARRHVASSAGSLGGVRGRWYRPRTTRLDGTILYFHGGGYVGTSPTMYASFVASLASRTNCEVFIVDYRLAPEYPFPAAIHDAIAVLTGALDGGTDPSRLLIAGDSAGGGLATALMCATEMADLPTVAGMILFSPEVDLRLDKPSMTENADLDILPSRIPSTAYLQGVDPGERCVSAIEHEIGRWPPTFVSFGAHEMFRDSIRLLVRRLDDADIDTIAIEEPGMFHVFPILLPWTLAAQRTLDAVQDFTATALASDAAEQRTG
jgi:monoterpene epsilon-lactone hydrolase